MEGESVVKEEEIYYEEPTTTPEFIASACNGLNAVADIDTALMSKEDAKRVHRIKRRSLRILDYCIRFLYDELFDDEKDAE